MEVSAIPTRVGVLWPSQDAAKSCLKGDIHLAFCQDCSFITNLNYDSGRVEYDQAYDNSLHFSAVFQEYARSLAQDLVGRYNLYEKDVIEIGSGQGDFLRLICELGRNRGVGFDPGYEHRTGGHEDRLPVRFVKDYYSENYAGLPVDFIYSRQVFEHIHRPVEFLSMLRRAIGARTQAVLFFEVPNVANILAGLSIWDLVYEHCSYFSLISPPRAFEVCGFEVLDLHQTYQRQFLGIEARPGPRPVSSVTCPHPGLPEFAASVAAFGAHFKSKVERWRSLLVEMEAAGRRAVLWGAGARGISFLNMLKIEDEIRFVVDVNPAKHGMYMAGAGQQIVPPEFLKDYPPDVIIILNPIYQEEIARQVSDLGLPSPTYLLA
jgi:hypothetical protein